jgi:hypothetical protein
MFPLLRPEKNRWYRAGIACCVLLLVWMGVSHDKLERMNYLLAAALLLVAIIRHLRLRGAPDRRVELDDKGIRLFPAGYWVVDEIRWNSVVGRREEGTGIFLHFKDDGTERAVEFERRLFSKEHWGELAGLLQGDTRQLPTEW